jgi:hypothetical protein
LEKNILIIERQDDVVPPPMLEEENANKDVEPHAQIDGGGILNLFYNLLPTHPLKWKGWVGLFLSIFFLL